MEIVHYFHILFICFPTYAKFLSLERCVSFLIEMFGTSLPQLHTVGTSASVLSAFHQCRSYGLTGQDLPYKVYQACSSSCFSTKLRRNDHSATQSRTPLSQWTESNQFFPKLTIITTEATVSFIEHLLFVRHYTRPFIYIYISLIFMTALQAKIYLIPT